MPKTTKTVVGAMSGTETRSDTASTAAMATSRNEAAVEADDEVAVGARVRAEEADPGRLNLCADIVIIPRRDTMKAVVVLETPRLLSASTAGTETMTRGTIHRRVASTIARIVEEIDPRLQLEFNSVVAT